MKFVRVLTRLAVLSLAAAAFVALTGIYGDSVEAPLPSARGQEERGHRPSAPEVDEFGEFIAAGVELAVCALAGRLVFRLRLSPMPRPTPQLLSIRRQLF